jgi:hypothetical protein
MKKIETEETEKERGVGEKRKRERACVREIGGQEKDREKNR